MLDLLFPSSCQTSQEAGSILHALAGSRQGETIFIVADRDTGSRYCHYRLPSRAEPAGRRLSPPPIKRSVIAKRIVTLSPEPQVAVADPDDLRLLIPRNLHCHSRLQSPFFWSPSGGIVRLGVFTGDARNYGFGVKDHNQVTGQVYFGAVVQAFLWSPTTPLIPLSHLPGGLHSVGTAINNHGSIVGTASLPDGAFTGMIWNRHIGMQNIGRFSGGAYSAAEGINDSHQVVGWGFTNSIETTSSAFYWSQSVGRHRLSTFGGDQTFAWGINQQGNIAGHSNLSGDAAVRATLWNTYTRTPTDLGTLPGGVNSYARGLEQPRTSRRLR
jgi:hypothetical protein